MAAAWDSPRKKALIEVHLEALAGRLMQSGGWVGGARCADAEPLWTGRSRPYDESTLRKDARELLQQGVLAVVGKETGGHAGSGAGNPITPPLARLERLPST